MWSVPSITPLLAITHNMQNTNYEFSCVLLHSLCHDFLGTVAKIATFHSPVLRGCLKTLQQLGPVSDKLFPTRPQHVALKPGTSCLHIPPAARLREEPGEHLPPLPSSASESIWEILSVIHFSSFLIAMAIDKTKINGISFHVNDNSVLKSYFIAKSIWRN